jgi:pilus assembly protein Flp/PilA
MGRLADWFRQAKVCSMTWIHHFLSDDEGTTAVEYAIMLAMILMAVITGVSAFGAAQSGYWTRIDSDMKGHGF